MNVGTHYLVSQDGAIIELLPTTIMGRHTIGFNHVSISIENVATSASELTTEQIQANVDLIRYLTHKHPSIRYLIGHHEYMLRTAPHFALYLAKDESYNSTIKIDPGFRFMRLVRSELFRRYQIRLDR